MQTEQRQVSKGQAVTGERGPPNCSTWNNLPSTLRDAPSGGEYSARRRVNFGEGHPSGRRACPARPTMLISTLLQSQVRSQA